MKPNRSDKYCSPRDMSIVGWVSWTVISLFVLYFPDVLVRSATAADQEYKNKYPTIEVCKFDVQPGIDVSTYFLDDLRTTLVADLKRMGKFKEVLSDGEASAAATAPVLRLTGTATKCEGRSMTSPVGLTVHLRWLDRASGELISEGDVRSEVVLGGVTMVQRGNEIVIQGFRKDSSALAEKIVKITMKKFF